MNFKYIFTGGLIFGTGISLSFAEFDKDIKKKILGVVQSGIAGSLVVGGWSLWVLGLCNESNPKS